MVTSRLNKRYIWQTLGLVAVSVLTLCGVSLFNKGTFLPMLLVWMGFTLLFSVFYLASIKCITIFPDGLETQNLLLPFWKRFYRFAEFDYALSEYEKDGEVYRLIMNGERQVSIASYLYLNFEEIKGAIAVKDKSDFSVRDNAEVVSEYKKSRLFGTTFFMLLFVLLGVLTSLADVIDGKPVRLVTVLIGASVILLFGSLLFIYLFSYKKITVWRGQVEVKRLLWPSKVRYYAVSEFDGFYYVLEKSNGQLGSRDENSIWLVKDDRLVISVDEPMYRNYEELRTVFQKVNCLGGLEFIGFQSMKYHLGKKFNWR
ncbi:MAG: hypothetical protein K6C10_11135 [Prevotella sp.]|nr:hypothetical protein [Prevotella sp.]